MLAYKRRCDAAVAPLITSTYVLSNKRINLRGADTDRAIGVRLGQGGQSHDVIGSGDWFRASCRVGFVA